MPPALCRGWTSACWGAATQACLCGPCATTGCRSATCDVCARLHTCADCSLHLHMSGFRLAASQALNINSDVNTLQHGAVQSKLEAICKEVGRIVEKAPPGARLGLWFGLLRGCDRAMADAPSLGKEPKVLSAVAPPHSVEAAQVAHALVRLAADRIMPQKHECL